MYKTKKKEGIDLLNKIGENTIKISGNGMNVELTPKGRKLWNVEDFSRFVKKYAPEMEWNVTKFLPETSLDRLYEDNPETSIINYQAYYGKYKVVMGFLAYQTLFSRELAKKAAYEVIASQHSQAVMDLNNKLNNK